MAIEYPPNIRLELVTADIENKVSFLHARHDVVKAHHPDGKVSRDFVVSSIVRKRYDAVAIVAYQYDSKEETFNTYLRSCLRPAAMLRDYSASNLLEDEHVGNFYEIPAGLVELDETGMDGLKAAAAREFDEEIGFTIEPNRFEKLGSRVFTIPGICAERIFFFSVEVKESELRHDPVGDGHPLEEGGEVKCLRLSQAIKMLNEGYLSDIKTEIGLYRLARKLKF